MTTAAPPAAGSIRANIDARLEAERRRRMRTTAELCAGAVVLVATQLLLTSVGGFPDSWVIPLADWVDDIRRWVIDNQTTHWSFSWIFNPRQ